MPNYTSGNIKKRREMVKYNGYQFNDFINDLMAQRNIMQIDLSRMTKTTPKTISEWATGLSIPNPANFQNVMNALAPKRDEVEREDYITKNTAIYNSIRNEYTKAKKIANSKN